MAFAPTLGEYVRAAGGLAYLAFGAYVLLHKPRSSRAVGLGGMLVSLGPYLVLVNLLDSAPELLGIGLLSIAVSIVPFLAFAVPFALAEAGPRRREAWLALGGAWILGAAAGVAFVGTSARLPPDFPPALDLVQSVAFGVTVATFAALLWILARRATAVSHAEFAGTAAVALGLALWPIHIASSPPLSQFVVPGRFDQAFAAVLLGTLAFVPGLLAWSRAGTRDDARARRALLAFLLGVPVAFLALVPFARPGNAAFAFVDAGFGVSRFLGIAILGYAVFRLDWLGWGRAEKKDRRAFLATGSMAILFMVAQVTENFLDASYGILTGGIVAAAFLLAARPIERALERGFLGTRPASVAASAHAASPSAIVGVSMDAREEAYVKALRIALKDRVVTPEEAVHLHELAETLGIGAGRAHALYVQVSADSGARDAKS